MKNRVAGIPTFTALVALAGFVVCDATIVQLHAAPFDEVAVMFEQNATDGDAEVVFEVTSGDEGLQALQVIAPDKRVVVDFKSPDSKLGIRQLQLESPEPQDIGAVKAAYPEGEYTFRGTTVEGIQLMGSATLSHKLPPTATFVQPQPDASDVPHESLIVQWKSPRDIEACIVVIEQEDDGLEVAAMLSGDATRFAVPRGFLAPATAYKVAIGTVSAGGNTSFVEAEFTTAKARP